MTFPSWFNRFFRYGRDPFRRYESGMTLEPGEETTVRFDLASALPQEIVAAVYRGEISLSFQQGEQVQIGQKRHRRALTVLLDNQPYADIYVEYSGEKSVELQLEGPKAPVVERKPV